MVGNLDIDTTSKPLMPYPHHTLPIQYLMSPYDRCCGPCDSLLENICAQILSPAGVVEMVEFRLLAACHRRLFRSLRMQDWPVCRVMSNKTMIWEWQVLGRLIFNEPAFDDCAHLSIIVLPFRKANSLLGQPPPRSELNPGLHDHLS